MMCPHPVRTIDPRRFLYAQKRTLFHETVRLVSMRSGKDLPDNHVSLKDAIFPSVPCK